MNRTAANDVLVTAFQGRVYGLESTTGAIRWEREVTPVKDEVEIAIEDGVVIAACYSRVAFIDLATGHEHASILIPGEYSARCTMVVQGGHLYIGRRGTVSCMTLRGQPVWTQPFTDEGVGSVALGFAGNVRQGDDVGGR